MKIRLIRDQLSRGPWRNSKRERNQRRDIISCLRSMKAIGSMMEQPRGSAKIIAGRCHDVRESKPRNETLTPP
jgi:hypothetical protein